MKVQLQKEQDRQDQRRALELNLVIGHVESVIRCFSCQMPNNTILFQVNFAKRSECKRCDTAMQEEWRCKGEGGGIGLDRWQAEVQQHQEYLDKVKRVQERKQANLKKLEEAGFTCNLEGCGQHFSSLPLFKEHVIKHKAKMKERLVCTEQVSKATVCEQKFANRRAYNQHQEEHKVKRLQVFQQDVRSVLLVNKLGLLLEAFEKEYRTMVGQFVPYKALGFSCSLELLRACTEAVEIQKVEGGHTLLVGKPDSNTAHMARMVANQREECRGYDYRTGEVLKNQSHASKKNIQKVAGERKRQVTPFLKEQVGRMMDLEEHQAGLEFGEFLDAYQELHDYPLEPVQALRYRIWDLGLGSKTRYKGKIWAFWTKSGLFWDLSGTFCRYFHENYRKTYTRLKRL